MGERSKRELEDNGDYVSGALRVSTANPQPVVHPHVVMLQVSIFNDEDYEIDSIHDLANRVAAGQGHHPILTC